MTIDEVDEQFAARFRRTVRRCLAHPGSGQARGAVERRHRADPAHDGHPARQAGLPGLVSAAVRPRTRPARRCAPRRAWQARGVHRIHVERNVWRQADRVGRHRPVHIHQWPDRRAGFLLRLHTADRHAGRRVLPGGIGLFGSVRSCSGADHWTSTDDSAVRTRAGSEPPWASQSSSAIRIDAIASAPSSRGRGSSGAGVPSRGATRSAMAASYRR